jgi:hypothetical protein
MDTATPVNPPAVVAGAIDDEGPGREATVQAWTSAARGLDFACTAVHPALSIIGLLSTPELRTAAFLAILRTEVARRSGKEHTL